MKTIYTLAFLFLCTMGMAQEAITSFRGWEWGKSFNEVADQLIVADTRTTRGWQPYNKKDEVLEFEGLKADNIIYLFKKGELIAGTVAMHNDNLEEIVKIFTEKYGEPKVVDAFVLTNYEWHLPTADMSITKIPSASNNIGVSVQIMGK